MYNVSKITAVAGSNMLLLEGGNGKDKELLNVDFISSASIDNQELHFFTDDMSYNVEGYYNNLEEFARIVAIARKTNQTSEKDLFVLNKEGR